MQDGHLNKCKTCTKLDTKERQTTLIESDPEWVEKERARHRAKSIRLDYKTKYRPSKEDKAKTISRYKQKYPEKEKCKYITAYKAPKPEKGFHRHHWCYEESSALDFIILPIKEHLKAHIYLVYDQERMMYRRSDNNELLNTKEKHHEYIMYCINNKPD